MSQNQQAATMSCIAYESIWGPTDAHLCHLGEGSLKGGGLLGGERGDSREGDQGPRSPANDEAKHSSELEDDKASH